MTKWTVIFLLTHLQPAVAATWYAAANGSSTNGTSALPWSLSYAVTNTNPHLMAGDTVLLKDGTFVCTETNVPVSLGSILEFRKSGTNNNRITYQAEHLWAFTFDGGIYIPATTSNLAVRNVRVTQSNIAEFGREKTNSIFQYPTGIEIRGSNTLIMHNLIENCGHPGIASWSMTDGKYIAGNIIRFVGYDDWTGGYTDENRGSGLYLQNNDDSSEALIQGNISYFNYTTGMKAYGNTDVWGFRFHQNITTDNPEAGIFYHQDNYPSSGVTISTNCLWNDFIRLGYPLGNGDSSNAVVAGNYVVSSGIEPLYQVDGWKDNTWTNNTAVRLDQRYIFFMEASGEVFGDVASHHIDYNTYYATNTGGFGAGPFFIKQTATLFADWKTAVGGDNNSTFSYSTPADNSVQVFAPSTDTNFVHIAVFNWTNATTATVDLSSYFPNGKRLHVYDAQNIPTAYTNFIYNGGSLALDLTLTNRATMLGTFSQRADDWEGFDDRFRAFVIYSETVVAGTVNTMNVGTMILR